MPAEHSIPGRKGQRVQLVSLGDVEYTLAPIDVPHYNMYAAAPINGNTAPGTSSGDAIAALDRLADRSLPRTMRTEWTELTFMQIRAGDTAMFVFALAVVFVFLVLAALYESWSLPLAVILVVPMCLLCSLAGVASVPHMDINIFTQIGFVVLVGLASKNAILIVEFAKQLREQGEPLWTATTQACHLRLRPIIMTSLAFILGVVPLVVAGGAGAEMRRTLGIAVFSGMLGVTLFGIFLTPVFFYVIQGIGDLPVFAWPSMRRLGWGVTLLLNLAMLGIPALLVYALKPVVKSRRKPAPSQPPRDPSSTPSDNGENPS